MRVVLATLAAGLGFVAWGEWTTRRASRSGLPADRLDARVIEPGEVVLVPGFRSSPGGRVNAIQRWRVRIAVRSTDEAGRFVFTGGPVRGSRSEASVMADHAVARFGVAPERIMLEQHSRTSWENIAFSLPLLADASVIKIASNSFHTRRLRAYLATQSPQLAARLRRAADYRFGEYFWAKPMLAVHELVAVRVRAAALERHFGATSRRVAEQSGRTVQRSVAVSG